MNNDQTTPVKFVDLIDLPQLQTLLELHFNITNVPVSILDPDQNRLVAVGLQDICTIFHRAHPVTLERCRQSDAMIKSYMDEGRYIEYKCQNGLWDLAMPVIIEGVHLATLFIGQFFYEDDKADITFFQRQAEECGFNREAYLAALQRVPVFARDMMQKIVAFYLGFVELLSEIGQLNIELEQRVKQRTAELEAANNELKDFAYVVSHDLKSPLRGISQLAYWLVTDYAEAFDAEGREMVDLLINRVQRMDNLIDGILEYSRIGRIVGVSEPIDLNSLVDNIIASLAPPEQFTITVEKPLPIVVGDKVRIQQVFQNLLDNAIKFMDKPQGCITVRSTDQGSHWQFQVADNGPGIDAKYYGKIFEIFETLQARDERESIGIGLSIVKRIVEFYGGKIWVESTVGKGSTFVFTLPKTPQ